MLECVMIDSREPEWIRVLTFGGCPVSVEPLDTGDLHLYCGAEILGVERKSSDDLLGTLRDDRLFPQLIKLRAFTPWSYLAVVGMLQPGINGTTVTARRENHWSWSSVAGTLLTIEEIGIHIVWVPTDTEYEPAMIRLANRERSPLRIAPAREASLLSEEEAILAALPGIGPERAEVVYRYAGSVAFALAYLTDDLWEGPKAPGIGPGIKRRVRQALGLESSQILFPIERDGNPRKDMTK